MSYHRGACYLLKNEHVRDPEWEYHGEQRRLTDYKLAVAVMSLDLAECARIAPHTLVAAYDEPTTLPAYGHSASIYSKQRDALGSYVRRDDTGQPMVNQYDNLETELTFEAADARAQWIAEHVVRARGFRFLYCDSLYADAPPTTWINRTERDQRETRTRWPLWADYYLARLRYHAGETVTILGNVGAGRQLPKGLDAYTVEGHASSVTSRVWQLGRFVNNAHALNVAWEWRPPLPDGLDGFVLSGEFIPGSI